MASKTSNLLPFHKQFPDKFRSQTIFGQYEKIYRRPVTFKKKCAEFIKQEKEEKIKLRKVIHFDNIANNEEHHVKNIKLLFSKNGLKMYGYSELKGLFFIPNYLSTKQQFEWIKQSIQEFSNAPYNNLTNLHQNNNNRWQEAIKKNNYSSFRELTWSNIGIEYDWTKRRYNLNNITAAIPECMLNLCDNCNYLLKNIGSEWHGIESIDSKTDENGLRFSMETMAQTAIINFFEVNKKRPMGGHKDAAELMNAPLISVSLGNTAIFLISKDDNVEPIPICLKSGDLLVMSGKARFALHCVARVVPNSCPNTLIQCFNKEIENQQINMDKKKELELMKKYIMETRINFNIRQVIEIDNDSNEFALDFHEIHSF